MNNTCRDAQIGRLYSFIVYFAVRWIFIILFMKDENHLLQKRVNLFDGISIVAGAMIGSGIFIVSADIARTVGSPGWLMIVWLITAVITVIGAISYGELASMMPHVGGQYVYLKEAYHPLLGFLFGWTTFLVI